MKYNEREALKEIEEYIESRRGAPAGVVIASLLGRHPKTPLILPIRCAP